MSYASETILKHLTDPDDIEYLAQEGFSADSVLAVIPGENPKKIVGWAVRYFLDSGRRQAPTKAAILQDWADEVEQDGIDLGEGEQDDDIAWLVESLRAQYAKSQGAELVKQSAMLNATADTPSQVEAIREITRAWQTLDWSLQPRSRSQNSIEGFEIALREYAARTEAPDAMQGLRFGLPELDNHLLGVHDGEVCTWAGVTGGGKSWLADRTVWQEFKLGRTCVLFTLENNLPTTFDRTVCMAASVDYERWQRGTCTDGEMKRFWVAHDEVMTSGTKFFVEMPPRGERTVHAMVRKAMAMGADSIVIDQLTFIEPMKQYSKQHDEIREILHDLKELISTGTIKIPCMLLHQINREGAAYARKNGIYLPEHMAYGSEVERTSDMVIPIFQSEVMERIEEAEFQLIKFRRGKKARWAVTYRLGLGDIRIRHLIDEDNPHAGDEDMAA